MTIEGCANSFPCEVILGMGQNVISTLASTYFVYLLKN